MTDRFALAFQFLTAIPLFKAREFTDEELARSMAAFPLVGASLGLGLLVFHLLIGRHFPPLLEGAALVALLAWATGGFHLDGVADTVDGLAGGWTRERSLEIMKDSRVGALGAVALILVVFLKAAALGYLPDGWKWRGILLAPAVARGAVVLLAYKSPYARPAKGLGSPYNEHLDVETLQWALLLSGAISLLAGWVGALAFGATLLFALWMKARFKKRLGGVTGDILGFAEEAGEILFLLVLHLFV